MFGGGGGQRYMQRSNVTMCASLNFAGPDLPECPPPFVPASWPPKEERVVKGGEATRKGGLGTVAAKWRGCPLSRQLVLVRHVEHKLWYIE